MTSLKPMPGILAVAEITEIHTNSISSKLLEYDRVAFLNIANIPGLWIRATLLLQRLLKSMGK